MRRAVVALFAVSVLMMVQAVSALAQHEGLVDDAADAGVEAELPLVNSAAAINWIGPAFPPAGGVTFTEVAGPEGAIGRSGGQLWYFSDLTLATKRLAYWGPEVNLIRCSFNGPTYDPGEVLQYTGITGGGGNVGEWEGQTHFSTSGATVYLLFRLTLTQGNGAGGPALPLTFAPGIGISNSAGAVLQVTSGLAYTARLEMFASSDNATWIPALDFYDTNNNGSTGAYTSVDAGFWYQPFQITTLVFGGGSITPPGPTDVAWDASSPDYAIAGNACWTLADVVVDGTISLGPVANHQFTNVLDDHTLAAYFDQNQQTLTTSVVGNGSIQADPDQANYGCGSTVGLKALADPGWHFEGWSGDVVDPSWSIDLLMDGDKSVTATFAVGLPVNGGPEVTAFALTRVAPNPASLRVGIEYTVARQAPIRLSVLDLQGRTVAVLADGEASVGRHEAAWDLTMNGGRVSPGLYFVRYEADGASQVRRFLLVR